MSFKSKYHTKLRLHISVNGCDNYFHLIPSKIFGDNNIDGSDLNEAPFLAKKREGDVFASKRWEIRAGWAAMHLTVITFNDRAVGISISPYTDKVVSTRLWVKANPHYERELVDCYINRLGEGAPHLCQIPYITYGLIMPLAPK